MAYIGSKPNDTRQLARREFSYAVTVASTTTFTGSDAGGKTLSYQPGELEVYMNGVRLDPADYTATTGSSVVLGSGANIGDNINIFAGQTLPTDDYVSKAAGGTFDGDVLFNTTNTLPAINNVEGVAISAGSYGGRLEVSRNSNEAVAFNRMNTDGNILAIKKDGTTVGSIGVSGGDLNIGTGDTGIGFADSLDAILPMTSTGNTVRSNAIDIGTSSYKFRDFYLSGGIQFDANGEFLAAYEEGTFTPNFEQSGATITHSSRFGFYTKVGRLVHCTGRLTTGSWTGGSGTISIGSLPFTTKSGLDCHTATIGPTFAGWSNSNAPSFGFMVGNDNRILLFTADTSDARGQKDTNVTSSGDGSVGIIFNVMYTT